LRLFIVLGGIFYANSLDKPATTKTILVESFLHARNIVDQVVGTRRAFVAEK